MCEPKDIESEEDVKKNSQGNKRMRQRCSSRVRPRPTSHSDDNMPDAMAHKELTLPLEQPATDIINKECINADDVNVDDTNGFCTTNRLNVTERRTRSER